MGFLTSEIGVSVDQGKILGLCMVVLLDGLCWVFTMVSLGGLCLGLFTVDLFGGLVRWFVFGIIYDGFVVWYR